MICCDPRLNRRDFLAGTGALTACAMAPRVASAAGARDPRLLVILLRGALDGLATVVPQADPAWQKLRDDANLRARGGVGLPLDDLFVLNPSLPNLHELYRQKQALFVHAVATPYRQRSHFDGQNVLESGLPDVARDATGWMNRMLVALEPDAEPTPVDATVERARGLMVGQSVPLILRGPAPVMAWSTRAAASGDPDTAERLLALYDRAAPSYHTALAQSLEARRLADGMGTMGEGPAAGLKGLEGRFSRMATGAGRLLAAPNGPRIASLSFDGWDTHANQGPVVGVLARQLGAFDAAVAALRETMRDVWADTTVLAVTEFGRTAYENGNDGTDHGTGSLAMLFGGAVAGGRVVADWPGLGPQALLENRDLAPTADLRGVLKGVAQDMFGLAPSVLTRDVFPGSDGVDATGGLFG